MPPKKNNSRPRPSGPRRRGTSIYDYFNQQQPVPVNPRARIRINPQPEEVVRDLLLNRATNLPRNRVFNLDTGRSVLRRNVETTRGRLRRRYIDREIRNGILLPREGRNRRLMVMFRWDVERQNGDILLNQYGRLNLEATPNWEQIAERQIRQRYRGSDVRIFNIRPDDVTATFTFPDNRVRTIRLENVRMRMTDAITIDGLDTKEIEWNRDGKNNCVINFLKYYYKDTRISKDLTKPYFDKTFEFGYEEEGVSAAELRRFCDNMNINMLALDEKDDIVISHKTTTKSRLKALVFRIKNDHINPIVDDKERRKIMFKNNNVIRQFQPPTKKNHDDNQKVVVLKPTEESTFDRMIKHANELKTTIPSKNIKITKDAAQLEHYILDGVKYVFENERNTDMIKFLGEYYKGETAGSIVKEVCDELKLPKSKFLKDVFDNLNLEHSKNKTHRGLYNKEGETYEDLNITPDDVITFDINKCHTHALTRPCSKWLLFDHSCQWEDYVINEDEVLNGLYFVETDDRKLFSGDKIYTNAIVEKGLQWGYINHSNIRKQLIASETLDKDYFQLYETIFYDKARQDTKMKKCFMNALSGMMGRTENHRVDTHMSVSTDDLYNYYHRHVIGKYGDDALNNFFCHIKQCEEENYYVYSYLKSHDMLENNVAFYHQILDHQAILLHDYIEHYTEGDWDKLVYRYIDSFTIMRDKNIDYENTNHVNTEIGKLKISKNHEDFIDKTPYRDCEFKEPVKREWTILQNIKTSNDVKLYKELIDKGLSVLTNSFAGAGKGFVIKSLDKICRTLKLTVTNVSARNIGGETLHSCFRYNDKDGKIVAKNIEFIKNNFDCLIIDEIEIVNLTALNAFNEIKKILEIPVLCFGDFNQLTSFHGNLQNHRLVGELCDYNKVELQYHENCRMDKELTQILEPLRNNGDIDSVISQFKHSVEQKELTKFNVCYTNEKRIRLNKLVSSIYDTKSEWWIPMPFVNVNVEWEGIKLHKDMPVMRTHNDHDRKMFNGEMYYVKSYDNQCVYITRNDVDYKEQWEDFFKYYTPSYAMTSHKIIGITCHQDIGIHEVNHRGLWGYHGWYYTTLSRARTKDQITIFDI